MPFGVGGIFISFLILYGNICIDYFDSVWKHIFRRPGKASGAATARRKLEPDGGSPNKYELGKRKPLGAGSTRRQEMG